MFKLFKKRSKKVADWELTLLSGTIHHLPAEFKHLDAQIKNGLFNASLVKHSGSGSDYVMFTFNSNLINRFENKKTRDYKIKGIKLYDQLTKSKLEFTIYVYSGVISGYLIEGAKKYNIDVSQIDTKSFNKIFIDNEDLKKLSKPLSRQDLKLINENDVYEVILNNKIYYHIQDLEDGDFIGIDTDKVIYKITQDPFETLPIRKSLKEILIG